MTTQRSPPGTTSGAKVDCFRHRCRKIRNFASRWISYKTFVAVIRSDKLPFLSSTNIFTLSGTAHFKNVNNCLNTNSYSETSGGLKLNVVHF
jgi:hypothetical protein